MGGVRVAIGLSFLSGAVLTSAAFLLATLAARPPSPPPAPEPPPAPALAPAPALEPSPPPAPSLTTLRDGSALYADPSGRIFVLHPTPVGLTLAAVYALRHDPDRGRRDPSGRADHGFYLDDISAERAAALERARAAFVRETRSGAVDDRANARAEAAAWAVLDAGDATLLLEALADRQYGTRRAAAFALGEAGFKEAAPMLREVLQEKRGDGAERARAILDRLE